MTTARARRTDPWTSWAAARSVQGITERQRAVLVVLRARGPQTDEQIAAVYAANQARLPWQSPSGLRTRRRELADKGLVHDTGHTRTLRSGREAVIWKATP